MFPDTAIILYWTTQVYVYDDVDNCEPTDDTNYKHFQGTVDGTGCINIGASSPPSGVTCSLYTNGGNADPAACDGTDMKANSAFISEITDVGTKTTCYGCVFFEAPDCNENTWIVVGDAQCPKLNANPAMSFRCVSSHNPAVIPMF